MRYFGQFMFAESVELSAILVYTEIPAPVCTYPSLVKEPTRKAAELDAGEACRGKDTTFDA